VQPNSTAQIYGLRILKIDFSRFTVYRANPDRETMSKPVVWSQTVGLRTRPV